MNCRTLLSLLAGLLFLPAGAQESISYTFDDGREQWETRRGRAELSAQGAWKGSSLKLAPGSLVRFRISVQPESTYELSARLRTESGADNMTLQITGLGKNNVSISSALASWTEVKQEFHVAAGQEEAVLEAVFDQSSGETHA